MSNPTVIKASGPADFLRLVPQMMGFLPTNSVLMVPFIGLRSAGVMRFDLPDKDLHKVASTMIGTVCRVPDVDRVAVVIYTDGDPQAHAPLSLALERAAGQCGLELMDVNFVGPDGYGSLLLPSPGGPLSEINSGVTAAVTTGAELPPVTDEQRRDVDAAVTALAAVVAALGGSDIEDGLDPQALDAVAMLDDMVTLFDQSLDWDQQDLAPTLAGILLWVLNRPALRDVGLMTWGWDTATGDLALAAQEKWEDGVEYPTELAARMWGAGPRPDADRLKSLLGLVRHVAALAPDGMAAGPLATLGWVSWALGQSSYAQQYATLAVEAQPEHGLAEIVLTFVASGHLPEWAFSKEGR